MKKLVSVETMREGDIRTIKDGISALELMQRAAMGIYISVDWINAKINENIKEGDIIRFSQHLKTKDKIIITQTNKEEKNILEKDGLCALSNKSFQKTNICKEDILIVCGGGNNGGDGFALAEILFENNFNVKILMLNDKLSETANYYYKKILNKVNIINFNNFFNSHYEKIDYTIIVDCIFGTGGNRNIDGIYKNAIDFINDSKAFKVSVDINSGLNGNNGRAMNIAVRSNLTISIGCLKQGLLYFDALDYIENLINIDIGIQVDTNAYVIEKEDIKNIFKKRKRNSHKGNYGKVGVFGGSFEYLGAVKLANMSLSSLLSGCGLSTVITAEEFTNGILPYLLESTLKTLPSINGEIIYNERELKSTINSFDVLAVGMGLGISENKKRILEFIIQNYKGVLLLDADALNILSLNINLLNKSAAKKIILTPHPKEFSKLSGFSIENILENPYLYSLEFAKKYNVILLLKGASTIITNGEKLLVSFEGSACLAKGGSGDVLSGIVAGINAFCNDALLATAAGSYIAGYTASLNTKFANEYTLLARDTIYNIQNAITKILE